jgi:lysine 2,3-aminomutase
MTARMTARTLRSVGQLRDAGLLPAGPAGRPEADLAALEQVAARYAVAITPAMAALIDRNDSADAIARQFIPDAAELTIRPEERADPIGDDASSPVEGVVHRCPDRVLLKLVHTCPVYCRFCFRREMVGPRGRGGLTARMREAAYAYIRNHREIWEVILTGGDPLVLNPANLRDVIRALAAIDHVKVIRIHTRVPVVAPERISVAMVAALTARGSTTYVALHANHPRELTASARAACARIVDAGIPMVSQSVLLRGINNDIETLTTLMRAFVECRVKPYYLHHPDLAPGTSHLRVSVAEGQELVRQLQAHLSGLCQPTYMLDIPGGAGKVPIGPTHISPSQGSVSQSSNKVRAPDGTLHAYPPFCGGE